VERALPKEISAFATDEIRHRNDFAAVLFRGMTKKCCQTTGLIADVAGTSLIVDLIGILLDCFSSANTWVARRIANAVIVMVGKFAPAVGKTELPAM